MCHETTSKKRQLRIASIIVDSALLARLAQAHRTITMNSSTARKNERAVRVCDGTAAQDFLSVADNVATTGELANEDIDLTDDRTY